MQRSRWPWARSVSWSPTNPNLRRQPGIARKDLERENRDSRVMAQVLKKRSRQKKVTSARSSRGRNRQQLVTPMFVVVASAARYDDFPSGMRNSPLVDEQTRAFLERVCNNSNHHHNKKMPPSIPSHAIPSPKRASSMPSRGGRPSGVAGCVWQNQPARIPPIPREVATLWGLFVHGRNFLTPSGSLEAPQDGRHLVWVSPSVRWVVFCPRRST